MDGIRLLIAAIVAPTLACGEPLTCHHEQFVVVGADDAFGPKLCSVAEAAVAELATCNLQIGRTIQIEVVPGLPPVCVGEYHCGDDRILVLSPSLLANARDSDNRFSELPDEAYFQSIVLHELVHAALDGMPCPFDSCPVTQEYVAYAMQVRGLSDEDRSAFLSDRDLSMEVPPDAINLAILSMAPDVFAARAYVHFIQQPDPCGYIGRIASGEILLDYEQF